MSLRNRKAGAHHRWKGGRIVQPSGYVRLYQPGHPRASIGGMYVLEQILVAEKALGKYLPAKAEVHHVDENKGHNVGGNLVVCNDRKYHGLLHQRTRALDACGNASALRCYHCHGYDEQDEIEISKQGKPAHKKCKREYLLAYNLRVFPAKRENE